MAIVLRNNSGRRLSFELPHEVVCTDDECTCNFVERQSREVSGATGEVGMRTETLRIPRAMVLPAGNSSEPLPDAIAEVPAVADFIKRGQLLTNKQEPPPPPRTRNRASTGSFNPPTGSTPPTS